MLAYKDISHWRRQIFSRLLTIVVVLGTILAVPSMALSFKEGLYPLIFADFVALVWIVAIWRLQRIPYTIRVLNFLAVMYLIGIALMLSVGPVSLIFLLALPVMASVLLGTIPAVLAIALGSATILVLGVGGYAKLYVTGLPDHELVPSLMVTFNFFCVGILITIPCDALLRRLSTSIDNLHQIAASLERRTDDLQKVNAELRLHATAVARLNDMVLIAQVAAAPGAGQPIIFVNYAFVRRTGYARDEVLGHGLRVLHGRDTDPAEVARITAAIQRVEPATTEILNYTRSGEPFWAEMELVPFADEGGVHTHLVMVGRDITERKKSASAIHRLAFYDVLTGLPNRRLLMDRLEEMVAQAHAGSGFSAVMFVDLDHFKFINDARGHATGDAVLRAAAEGLEQLVREDDTIARLGGDEFVVLLASLGHDTDSAMRAALRVAEKVRNVLGHGFRVEGHTYTSSASIGVSLLLPKPGQTAQDLLREADTAMYRAKAEGRNNVVFFEARMQADVERRLTLERDLGMALANGELAMHIQVQVDIAGQRTGAEMLMRWKRADGSMVPPDVFIPVAEASGLIIPLGQWALRQACLAWMALARTGNAMPLSVNVSPSQFRQPDFVERVREVLHETGAPAAQLIFEVTEGLLIEDLDKTIARMHELAAMGIRFSIDDFGTGYSNLGYLRRMPLYELKIDQSFIRDTPADSNSAALVQSILAMAGHLGLRVVAEGVETVEQAEFLAAHGSPQMQGYLFGQPIPLPRLLEALEDCRVV
ncbi:MAG TPA: EAL domain-containing protein [Telluria sp.]